MTEPAHERIDAVDVVRFVCELVAFGALAAWGVLAFGMPWPGLLLAVALPAAAIALWALFCSPRAVIDIGVVGRSAVEAVVMGAATVALWMTAGPIVAIVFGVAALVTGVISGIRRARRERLGA